MVFTFRRFPSNRVDSGFKTKRNKIKRIFDFTLAAVRTADPEGELTNLRRSAESSKIMRSARFEVHEAKPF